MSLLRTVRHWVWVMRTLPGPARRWAVRRLLERPDARRRRLEAALANAAGRLMFVCHGNIMRSAFATEVARAATPALAPRIVGAGTHANTGRPAQDSALRVAPAFGVTLGTHTATSLEVVAIAHDDVVVCMDVMNEANVLARVSRAERVFLVGDIEDAASMQPSSAREVPDPYGQGDAVTHVAFARLHALAARWATRFAGAEAAESPPFH